MIQPKELRIGNYLYWDADHGCAGVLRVEGIREYNFLAVGLAKCQPTSQFEYEHEVDPIPITPEWLENLGFKFIEILSVNDYESEDQYIFRHDETNFVIGIVTSTYGGIFERSFRFRMDGDIIYLKTKLEYVHQLQNLYFALTGEELTIKETV